MCFSPFFSKGTLTATAFQFSSCCYNFARHVCLYINTKGMGTTLPTSPTPPYKIFLCRHFLVALPTSTQFYLSKTWAWDRNQIRNRWHHKCNSPEFKWDCIVIITKPCTCVRISLFIVQLILSKWPSKPYPFDSLPIKTLKFFSKNSEIKWMMQNRVWTHHLFLLTRHVTPALEMILNFIARRIKSYLRSTSWYKIKHCFLVFFKLESPILKNVSSHIECLAHFIQWLFSVQSVLLHNFCWQVFCCCMAVKRFTYKNMRSPAILFHSKE